MRFAPIVLLATASLITSAGRAATAQTTAQPAQQSSSQGGLRVDNVFDATGCANKVTEYPIRFTVSDQHHNRVYRLTGTGLEGWWTKNGPEADDNHRVHVVGGLVPNATLAAQNGSTAPSITTRQTNARNEVGRGWQLLPDMRVKQVQTTPGSCP
jgi:hypothetical protein